MTYEEKLEARRDGLRAKAARVETEGNARIERSDAMGRMMNGQPILIGHHSEKRHRRDISRMHDGLRKGFEQRDEAKELRRRADAVGSGGISSDDEQALVKLRERIAGKEKNRDRMKEINKAYRKRDVATLENHGLDLTKLDAQIADAYSWEKQPFPKWEISNLGATIRADKKRLVVLEAQEQRAEAAGVDEVELAAGESGGIAFRFIEDHTENRIICYFDSKPSRAALDTLRSYGWKYSPSRTAHVRKISPNAIAYAPIVAKMLRELGA